MSWKVRMLPNTHAQLLEPPPTRVHVIRPLARELQRVSLVPDLWYFSRPQTTRGSRTGVSRSAPPPAHWPNASQGTAKKRPRDCLAPTLRRRFWPSRKFVCLVTLAG